MKNTLSIDQAKGELFALLQRKSVFHGEFKLSSGATSSYYIDCRLTTLDPQGAWLVGQVVHHLIRTEAAARNVRLKAVGGLTMGADPIALAVGMFSVLNHDPQPLQVFSVRKAQKSHGQGKRIEGNFQTGKVAFVAVLVDRQEGGRLKIEQMGYPVFPVFQRDELLKRAGELE